MKQKAVETKLVVRPFGGMPYSHTFLGGTVQSRTERGYD